MLQHILKLFCIFLYIRYCTIIFLEIISKLKRKLCNLCFLFLILQYKVGGLTNLRHSDQSNASPFVRLLQLFAVKFYVFSFIYGLLYLLFFIISPIIFHPNTILVSPHRGLVEFSLETFFLYEVLRILVIFTFI